MQAAKPCKGVVESTPSTHEVSDSNVAQTEPPVKMSVLEKFFLVRGLKQSENSQRRLVQTLTPTKLTARGLSKTYTKRRHGQKTAAQRAALREPVDIFSDSVDAYVPRKRKQELMNLHKDENEVNEAFLVEARALAFEREVLDKVVCDREENRYEFEEKLWQLMVKDRGLQEVEDEQDNQMSTDDPV